MKRLGYTLSEVLITLGIIGVIAAISIPSLVNEYNKQIYAKTLSVAVSDFEAAMKNMIQKEAKEDLLKTKAWDVAGGPKIFTLNEEGDVDSFKDVLIKYLPVEITTKRTYNNLGSTSSSLSTEEMDSMWFSTNKGVEYAIYIDVDADLVKKESELIAGGYTYRNKAADVCIDVNGKEKPNTFGRDFFCYELSVDGDLHALGGYEYAKFNYTGTGQPTIANAKTKCVTDKDGVYCAEYLKQNNYKMDY